MKQSPDRLYELLPAIHRIRDAEVGHPLRDLMRVIAEQVAVVEEDIERLYDNWFIETCDDWVVPYIGDLIGYLPVREAGEQGDVSSPQGRALNKILIRRREVANTILSRRRKGTLSLLESLAGDVAGWPARVVEFYKLLGWTQHLDHQRLHRGRALDLRDGRALDYLDGPFDAVAHTVEVRRVNSPYRQGRYNIPSAGVFVWRLKSYSVTKTQANCFEEEGAHCYTFSALWNDMQLYNRPQPETAPTHIAEDVNLPTPILRRALKDRMQDFYGADENGVGRSFAIWAKGWPNKDADPNQPIPPGSIIVADLSDWRYRAPKNHIAVDPVLGRIAFPEMQLPRQGVVVSYHYAFAADIGGGEYHRSLSQPEGASEIYRVGKYSTEFRTISDALKKWSAYKQGAAGAKKEGEPERLSLVIEIVDSGVYREPNAINIALCENESVQIRAANGARPIIRVLDYTEGPDAVTISGAAGSRFTMDGLMITGRGVRLIGQRDAPVAEEANAGKTQPCPEDKTKGYLCEVTIRHCTLVPGWELRHDCEPKSDEPSLMMLNVRARVRIEHSIVGSIRIVADQVVNEPFKLEIGDSIVDATDERGVAIGGSNASPSRLAFAELRVVRSTVIGQVLAHAITLAENSIFKGLVRVARSQIGCARFCYIKPGSRTPRRYNCQPDLAKQAVADAIAEQAARENRPVNPDEIKAALEVESRRVTPQFSSARYGSPTYGQLAAACAEEIKRGADDKSEMGVFHDLYQPQREANLRARLDEYTPAGMEAGIIYAN
jgi:hypothetical protein